jgi:hypothetical protein
MMMLGGMLNFFNYYEVTIPLKFYLIVKAGSTMPNILGDQKITELFKKKVKYTVTTYRHFASY